MTSNACHGINYGRARGSQAIPGHMVGTAAAIALHRRNGGSVQGTSRRRCARGEAYATCRGGVRARSGDVSEAAAVVTLLACADPQAGALGLNMTHSATGVALLGRDSARRWASRRLVPWLAAVVAETLLGGAVLRNVAEVAALEAPLPAELIRHGQTSLGLDASLFRLTLS